MSDAKKLAKEKARRRLAEDKLARVRAVLNEPSPPNSYYLNGFATKYEALTEFYGEELPAALHAILEED